MAKKKTFEKALEELEQIVGSMEEGNMPLDESVKSFTKGVKLIEYCQQLINEAELKVRKVTKSDDGYSQDDFE